MTMVRKSRRPLSITLSAAAIAAAVAVQVGDRGMSISEAGVDLVMQFESCRVAVYRDPVGLPTAGCGHLVTADDDYKVGQKLTESEIRDLFVEDLKPAVQCVNKALGWKVINQGVFDVYTDVAFNAGCFRFRNSTALKCYLRGDEPCAKRGVAAFRVAGGRVNRGLVRRRTAFLEQRWGRP